MKNEQYVTGNPQYEVMCMKITSKISHVQLRD